MHAGEKTMNAVLRETEHVAAPLAARGLTHCYEGSIVLRGWIWRWTLVQCSV